MDHEKTSQIFTAADFFASLATDAPEQTADDQISLLETIFADAVKIEPPLT